MKIKFSQVSLLSVTQLQYDIEMELALASVSYLDFPGAVVHHLVLRSHGVVGVQGGGIEGDLLHLGDLPDGVGFGRARGLVLILPVTEELLEESCLAPCRQHLDLQSHTQTQR